MPDFVLYNTLTRRIDPFAPADGETVRMYTCGPTVYNPAHIGNFRTFLFEDLLRRALRLRGWKVRQVMNLTDVDDKIIRKAEAEGTQIGEVTEKYSAIFHADRDYLRIEAAEVYPRATEYIAQMIEVVRVLVERGLAYQADDGSIYFAISRFPTYGRLSRLDTREIRAGARVAQDDYTKENAQDFALWKAAKDEDERTGAAWDSPWGRGRPGWHLECSAMAMDLLGETLDIHCGAVDLIFPHHEDEIAQSEGVTGKPFSHFWCHGAFLLTEGAKMAKRVGNIMTVAGLQEAGYSAAGIRHFVFNTHYRKELNLTEAQLDASATAVRGIGELFVRLWTADGGTPELARVADEAEQAVKAALFDDLNGPQALAAMFTFKTRANAELDRHGRDAAALERARQAFLLINGVLDIVPGVSAAEIAADPAAAVARVRTGATTPAGTGVAREDEQELAAWVEDRLRERKVARAERNFARSDFIRDQLAARGIEIRDTAGGTEWRRTG